MSNSLNHNSRQRRKEKALALIIIITSTSILVMVMLLGKMLGREMSAQQELLKERFPVKNISGTQNELEQLSPQQQAELSRSQILLFILLSISSSLVFVGLLIARKFKT